MSAGRFEASAGDRGRRRAAGGDRWRVRGRADGPLWVAVLVFLVLCLLGGGSNLPYAPGLVVLRPAAILLIAALLIARAPEARSGMRVPALLLAAMTASILIQLVPLPPAIWWRLPGRSELAGLSAVMANDAVWRPLSLTPGLTWNSLLATLPSWVVVLALARLPRDRDRALAEVVVIMALASCLVGLLQLIGGRDSAFYFYKTDGSVSGLLANRNHQATLLAMALPLLRVWTLGAAPESRLRRDALALLVGALVLGMILLTGSRSGLIAALIGTVSAYAIAPDRGEARGQVEPVRTTGRRKIMRQLSRWGIIALPVLLVLLLILTGRDLSIQRLFQADYAGEIRLRSLPTTLSLVRTYFPAGSGYGSFDTVFRMHEPDALLKPTFFNRAHNDYLELAITGGLFPLIVLGAAMIWVAWAGWRAFRCSWRQSGVAEARAGVAMLVILALASASDYPVRAPLITAVATLAVCWIARVAAREGNAYGVRTSGSRGEAREGIGVPPLPPMLSEQHVRTDRHKAGQRP